MVYNQLLSAIFACLAVFAACRCLVMGIEQHYGDPGIYSMSQATCSITDFCEIRSLKSLFGFETYRYYASQSLYTVLKWLLRVEALAFVVAVVGFLLAPFVRPRRKAVAAVRRRPHRPPVVAVAWNAGDAAAAAAAPAARVVADAALGAPDPRVQGGSGSGAGENGSGADIALAEEQTDSAWGNFALHCLYLFLGLVLGCILWTVWGWVSPVVEFIWTVISCGWTLISCGLLIAIQAYHMLRKEPTRSIVMGSLSNDTKLRLAEGAVRLGISAYSVITKDVVPAIRAYAEKQQHSTGPEHQPAAAPAPPPIGGVNFAEFLSERNAALAEERARGGAGSDDMYA